jgi:hypothetical protein
LQRCRWVLHCSGLLHHMTEWFFIRRSTIKLSRKLSANLPLSLGSIAQERRPQALLWSRHDNSLHLWYRMCNDKAYFHLNNI